MRKLLFALLALALGATPALAQSSGVSPGGQTVPGAAGFCFTGTSNTDGTLDVAPCSASTPLPVAVASQALGQFPLNTTPITASAGGTTGAVSASLAGVANNTTYVCGFSVTIYGGTATFGPVTLSGTLGGSLIYQAASTAAGVNLNQTFDPCIPASAANTAIQLATTADATATAVRVNLWGFQAATAPYAFTSLTGNATGTTGAVVGTLTSAVGKTAYICGLAVSAIGGTATVSPITVAGTVTGSMVYQMVSTATGNNIRQEFRPCIPASATNTNITVTTTADGTATAVDVNSWGFLQ